MKYICEGLKSDKQQHDVVAVHCTPFTSLNQIEMGYQVKATIKPPLHLPD